MTTATTPRLATIAAFAAENTTLAGCNVLKAAFELPWKATESLMPRALAHTNPPYLTIIAATGTSEEFGDFAFVQAQAGCRSGSEARVLALATIVQGNGLAALMESSLGFACAAGEISLYRRYDGIVLTVTSGGRTVLSLSALNPVPMTPIDISYNPIMTLAETPMGRRLVDHDFQVRVLNAERLVPRIDAFEPSAWGLEIAPTTPIAASMVAGDVTFPPVRHVADPDLPPGTGTEAVTPS